jgi:hypothetical protein
VCHAHGVKFPPLYHRIAEDPQSERALLSAVGFTGAFAACRGITHAIRAGVGPFGNMSVGGRHLHHSTPGILGLLSVGFLWTQQAYTGHDAQPQWGSRITATLYGVFSALTLDEFALWMDLSDDYWTPAGRKSIDAAVIFGGLVNIVAIVSSVLDDGEKMPGWLKRLGTFDVSHTPGPAFAAAAPATLANAPAPATAQ